MKTEQEQIAELKVSDLRKTASKLGVKNIKNFNKVQLVEEIEKAFEQLEESQSQPEEVITETAAMKVTAKPVGKDTAIVDVVVKRPTVDRVEIDRIKALSRSKSEKFRMLFLRGMRACDIASEFDAHYSFVYGAIQRMNQD